MKNKSVVFLTLMASLLFTEAQAQINLGEKALGALAKGVKGFMFSNEEAAALSKAAVDKMDAENQIATEKDPYAIRLNKIFGKHKSENGLALNYKVYLTKELNAFATADGSVRVYSGLMDVMDDNELLAVIGHEIGHVANNDSRDAVKAAYKKEALIDAVASQSDKISALSSSQLGAIGSAMIDSSHSRKQESEADLFSYEFMKKNGYNVNAVESAFNILAKMSEGSETDFITKMMSSHPDSKQRAADAKARAEADGLYKPYVKIVPVAAKTTTKATAKKTVTKKKK